MTKRNRSTPNTPKPQMVSVGHLITQGPLPNPEILAKYEQISPGTAERILAMAEDEARHRREMEKKVLEAEIEGMKAEVSDTKRGQWFGLIIGLTAITAGSIVSLYGSAWSGGFIGTAGVIGLVTAFIGGRKTQQNNGHNA